ncbi:MAG: hypothetical protein IKK36_06120 [Bacteroidales bacterium]|nr:hypothetical protein [Bacteroidales bacterium]MBR6066427.1 hypothetical protein [Bacteroidales bacterium]
MLQRNYNPTRLNISICNAKMQDYKSLYSHCLVSDGIYLEANTLEATDSALGKPY